MIMKCLSLVPNVKAIQPECIWKRSCNVAVPMCRNNSLAETLQNMKCSGGDIYQNYFGGPLDVGNDYSITYVTYTLYCTVYSNSYKIKLSGRL